MGFNTVYRCLMEMFPQIDTRLLKAVAIEHSKDADAAANVVLTEILPSWSKQACPVVQSTSNSFPKNQSPRGGHSDGEGAVNEERSTLHQRLVERRRNKTLCSSQEPGSLTSGYATNTALACVHDSDSTSLSKALNASAVSLFANGGRSQLFGNTDNEEVILLRKTQEIGNVVRNKVSTAVSDAPMNYEGDVCAYTESIDSVSLDKGQDINVKVDDFSAESNDSVLLEKGQVINVKADDFSAEVNDSVSLDKGQVINVKADDFSAKSNDSVSLSNGQDINFKAADFSAESNDSVSLDKAQDVKLKAADFGAESDDSESLDKGQNINFKAADFSAESNDPVSLDKGQDTNFKAADFGAESNDSVSLDKDQDINFKAADFGAERNDSVSFDKGQDNIVNVDPEHTRFLTSTCLVHVNGIADGALNDWKYVDSPGATTIDSSNSELSYLVESCLDCPPEKVKSSIAQSVQLSVQEHASDVPECGLQSEIGSGTPSTNCGKPDSSGSSDLTSKQENFLSENGNMEDESTINSQVCKTDLLEEMITDAKNNKKTLFIAMESVMNLMREVESQEKAAAEAKDEAGKGGLDVLVKVEELKQMLAHAKEANDMHAGEIYGEKAILATEARELQNRLLSLSEERDKSLAILEEMHKALKARLAAAEEMRKAAEQEKLEKEESARNYLAEQEAIMEKVVQESKILQNQAEENSKLQEFLMDRGRVVDSLQGEISVICHDVRLLKEKFDEHVPLSKSVSSSQTTCILASSSSSLKSMASLVAEQSLASETTEKMSPTPSVKAQSPRSKLEDGRTGDIWRELLDEGWDFFENDTELHIKSL